MGAYVLHVVGGNGFAAAINGALRDDDDVEPRPSAARLARWGGKQPPWLSQNSPVAKSEHPSSRYPLLAAAWGGGSGSGWPSPRASTAPGTQGLDLRSAECPISQGQWWELPKLRRDQAPAAGLSPGACGDSLGRKGGWDCRTPSRPRLTSPSLSHMRSSQPSSGGDSGMKSQSAPEAKPDTSARYLGGTRRWQHQSRNVASRPTDGLPHAWGLTRSGDPSPPARTSAGGCKDMGGRRRVGVMPRVDPAPGTHPPSPLTSVLWW